MTWSRRLVVCYCFLFLSLAAQERVEDEEMLDLFLMSCNINVIYRDEMKAARERFVSRGQKAAEFLVTQLSTRIARERYVMREFLFPSLASFSVPPLLAAIDTARDDIKSFALYCLGKVLAKNDSIRLSAIRLRSLLNNPSWQVRNQLCFALAYCEPDSAVLNGMISILEQEPHEIVRKSATFALGRWQEIKALPVLIKTLGDSCYAPRMAAEIALERWDNPSVDSILIESYPMKSLKVRRLIIRVLKNHSSSIARDFISRLQEDSPYLKMELSDENLPYPIIFNRD